MQAVGQRRGRTAGVRRRQHPADQFQLANAGRGILARRLAEQVPNRDMRGEQLQQRGVALERAGAGKDHGQGFGRPAPHEQRHGHHDLGTVAADVHLALFAGGPASAQDDSPHLRCRWIVAGALPPAAGDELARFVSPEIEHGARGTRSRDHAGSRVQHGFEVRVLADGPDQVALRVLQQGGYLTGVGAAGIRPGAARRGTDGWGGCRRKASGANRCGGHGGWGAGRADRGWLEGTSGVPVTGRGAQ